MSNLPRVKQVVSLIVSPKITEIANINTAWMKQTQKNFQVNLHLLRVDKSIQVQNMNTFTHSTCRMAICSFVLWIIFYSRCLGRFMYAYIVRNFNLNSLPISKVYFVLFCFDMILKVSVDFFVAQIWRTMLHFYIWKVNEISFFKEVLLQSN